MSRIIKPYGTHRKLAYYILVLSVLLFTILFVDIFSSFEKGTLFKMILLLCIIVLNWLQLKLYNYYVEWFDDELHYYMPKCKKTVKIKYSDITDVVVNPATVDIHTKDGIFTVYLDNMMPEDMKEIKQRIYQLVEKK